VGSEVNPQFANIVSPSEVVVVTSFHIDLEGGGGDMHICLPYSMIEPIRDLLDAGVQSDRGDKDERWVTALKEELMGASVELSSLLTETTISMKELANLKKGDIIPIDIPPTVAVSAADAVVFNGTLGVSDGNYAIKIDRWVERPKHTGLEDILNAQEHD
jgi:flagellar motor switch protein FliM